MSDKTIIGRLESISLPDLMIETMSVRIDTGAKTSSLHVDNITETTINGKPGVSFDIHPNVHNVEQVVNCSALLSDIRKVKSSNGITEQRYVIETPIKLGKDIWPIEITLTDRSDMSYLMLLGREGMGKRFLVDPARAYVASAE
ncbi:ATP-dependent zinc protease [Thalassotalea sp. G2M2-11]|uniref:ATP-dependent zinc protease family protein n=1 Tax=Thalassotalea sp. G2M2-11 TaxID=2787627 RepID=UPI0019CFD53E|nr:ATP-dependent zinc protease [Thalassotalea sp. G2M2-11]